MSRASDVMGANAPIWLSGKVYRPGDLVKSPADRYQLYVRTSAAGSGTTDPSADPGNYTPFGARAIKSIQRGVISLGAGVTTATATITSVNTGKAQLRHLGGTAGAEDGLRAAMVRLVLTNATTVTAVRDSAVNVDGVVTATVSWELTEDY